jgi:hypothetical protein
MIDEVMEEVDAVVVGNRGFKEGTINERTLSYGGMVQLPHFVVTHEAREPVTIGGLTFTFLSEAASNASLKPPSMLPVTKRSVY